MGQLDASIVTVALPGIGRDLHASATETSWVSLFYLITLVGLVTPVGIWADAVGRKALYVGGFAVFTLATLGCALAPNLPVLWGFRIVQGGGAALLQANSVALVAIAAGRERLVRAVGIQATAQALGLALGPAVGGLLLAAGGWRLIFLVTVPAGVVGVATGLVLLPRSRDLAPSRQLDLGSLALLVSGVAATLLGLSSLDHTPVVGGAVMAIGVVLVTALVRRERRSDQPLVDDTLLAEPRFRSGLISGACAYALLFGLLVAVPFALAHAGTGASRIGLLLAALPAGLGLATLVVGRRLHTPLPGLLLTTVGVVAIAILAPSGVLLAALLAVVGAGLGLFTPPNNGGVMACARPDQSGAASGLLNTARGLGTALGTAIAALTANAGLRTAVVSLLAVLIVGLVVTARQAAP
jgi:MFS family permease